MSVQSNQAKGLIDRIKNCQVLSSLARQIERAERALQKGDITENTFEKERRDVERKLSSIRVHASTL